MKLQLTETEIDKVLLDIFSNGGLNELNVSGVNFFYNEESYEKFKVNGASYEENLLSLLKNGGRLRFKDFEEGQETVFLTYNLVKERLSDVTDSGRIEEIGLILGENYGADAWTGYNLIQFLLYGEVIFG